MKRSTFLIIFSLVLFFSFRTNVKAQSAKLIGENMLNSAITGTALGIATMGLQNSNDFAPLRVGLGAGIIGGTAIAIYDISSLPKGQQFYISGLFNDGTNSSIIILLDTFYGASVGAALGSAIMLISDQSVLEGLQYGTSAGAWIGFGVGLVDSFLLSEKNSDFIGGKFSNQSSLFQIGDKNQSLSLVEPELLNMITISEDNLGYKVSPAVNLFSFRKTF